MKYFLVNMIFYIFVSMLSAQTSPDSLRHYNDSNAISDSVLTGKIFVVGNKVTDDDIILREVFTRENSKLDASVLQDDVNRIYKLGLFNKVDVYPVPTDSANLFNIMFLVEERFYILPIPQGGFRNGEFSKFWGGLNIKWNNFRGRNETASLSFGLGYEPFIDVRYFVPWIGRKAHFYSSAEVGYSKNYNRSLLALNDTTSFSIPSNADNFAIYNFNVSYTLGKYFTKNFSLASTLKYNIINSSKYQEGRTVSQDGKDNFLTFNFSAKFDTRNSNEYTLAGSYYFLEYQKFGFAKLFDFNRLNFETRKFIPVKLGKNYSITFASRTLGALSFGGTIPYYLKEYFGYDNIIRGYKKVVYEGENKLGLFNELRIPVIDPFYVEGKSLPAVNRIRMLKNLNYKFGLYATLFFDVGGVWNKTDNFFKTQFRNGFGAGLNFILPFGFVGRTDFAFRKEQKKFIFQIIFDLGASF
ncbi:MAG: POTRA domain-containing protein [bacterium]